MNLKQLGQLIFIASSTATAACSPADADDNPSPLPQSDDIVFSTAVEPSISGIAPLEKGQKYIGVYDHKDRDDPGHEGENEKPRFFIMETNQTQSQSVTITDITSENIDWGNNDQANDLEAICSLGNDAFLAMESGYFTEDDGNVKYGRLIELKMENNQLRFVADYALPTTIEATEEPSFEGLTCAKSRKEGESDVFNLLIGDRVSGELYWNQLDVSGGEGQGFLTHSNFEKAGTVSPADSLEDGGEKRAITDLYAYGATVYGISAIDPDGQQGVNPESVIYTLPIDLSSSDYMQLLVDNTNKPDLSGYPVSEKIENYKLEAITDFGQGALMFASDNDGENNTVGAVYK